MSELGQKLKERREALGLTIEDVARETRIKPRFIEALEKGDYGLLPGDIFAKGFIRNYSSFLGLDPGEMLKLYAEERGGPALQETTLPRTEVPLERPPARLFESLTRLLPPLLMIILIVALGWFTYTRYYPSLLPTPTSTTPPTPTLTPTETQVPTPTWTPTPTSTPTPHLLTLTLVGIERSWLEVKVDGNTVFTGFLNPEETLTWSGMTIYVKCGNAGGVKAVVNGEEIGVLGGLGEVLSLEWRAGHIRPFILTPAPSPTPEVTATPEA